MSDEPSAAELQELTTIAKETVSPADRLSHLLHPVTSFFIVPLFALANAGIPLGADVLDAPGAVAVAAGVTVGLVVGKLVGVVGATWLAVRMRVASLPSDVDWRQLSGAGRPGGNRLHRFPFITSLAFDDSALRDAAKAAVLVASIVASTLGALILVTGRPLRLRRRAQ